MRALVSVLFVTAFGAACDNTPAASTTPPDVSVITDLGGDAPTSDVSVVDALDATAVRDVSTTDSLVDVTTPPDATAPPDAGPPFDWNADFTALTEGVRTLNLGSSLASALVVHGDTAFPVAFDANHATFVAAARFGMGRVIEFGHESLANNPRNTTDDRGRLTLNTVRWMTAGRTAPIVGIEGNRTELRDFLTANGFTVRAAAVGDLDAVQVWVTDAGTTRTEEQETRIRDWVRAGGGLVMTGHAWYWGYSHDDAAVNFPGNRVLSPMGVTISSENDVTNGVAVPIRAPTDLDHALRALEGVRLHVAGSAALSMSDQVLASSVVRRGVRVMNIASPYFMRVRAIRTMLPDVVPSTSSPVRPATQPIPALTVTIDTRLALGLPPAEITAHPAAMDFPGAAPSDTSVVSHTQTIDATYGGRTDRLGGNGDRPVWRSTGLYAPPGAHLTVSIPSTATSAGLTALIGSWTDDNFETASWTRMPVVTRSYALTATETTIASAFGGLVYIRVPRNGTLGRVLVTLRGGIPAPRYVHGQTTLAAWRTTERSQPGPYAELETSKLVLTVPSSMIRTLDDPSALMTFWDRVMDADADLATLDRNRVRAERIVFDRQIVAGYMHAGYPIMAFTPQAAEAVDLATLQRSGNWGFFHELGHNHQFTDWQWTGTGEATVNLYSVYVMQHVVGMPPLSGHPAVTRASRTAAVSAYIAGGRNFARDWSVWTALETFLHLQEGFGWDFFTRMNREYMSAMDVLRPRTEAERINGWVTRSCRIADRNLGPFYTSWGFPLTDASRTACAALPAWAENPMR